MDNEAQKTVCCRNINIISRYVQRISGSAGLLYTDLDFSEEYLRDEHNWVPLEVYCTIMERAIDLLKDSDAPFKMGLSAQELDSWGTFRYLQKVFGSVILGPIEIYKQVGKYNQYFNQNKDLIVAKEGKNNCYIKVKFKNNVNPVDDYVSDPFIRGILTGIPKIWHLPLADIREPMYEYDLEYLLRKVGQVPVAEISFADDVLSVQGRVIGRRVALMEEEVKEEHIYSGQYRELRAEDEESGVVTGILITENVDVNGQLKLKKDQIYNAPYFIYIISWQPLSFFRKIYQLTIQSFLSKKAYQEGLESQLSTIKSYVENLEEKVLIRTAELNETKVEAEYWRGKAENLLHTILPQHIADKMMLGKLVAEEKEGAVIFTDLVGFTNFSRNLPPQEVSEVLTGYFTEMSKIISEHHGWVNKFMGDGILAIFGLHEEGDFAGDAVAAAIKMQKAMNKYPWKKRIGVSTGPFITGEFGTESLRRFDCLGHTVNLAQRLESQAESSEILVCLRTYEEVKDKVKFSDAKKISPKGIGDIEVYPVDYQDQDTSAMIG